MRFRAQIITAPHVFIFQILKENAINNPTHTGPAEVGHKTDKHLWLMEFCMNWLHAVTNNSTKIWNSIHKTTFAVGRAIGYAKFENEPRALLIVVQPHTVPYRE